MQMTIIILTFLMTFNFIMMSHPLSMGLMLLIQTILISLISGLLMKSFWFSYILFLIMLGGMLVLFIYMTSLASNELFMFSNKIMLSNLIILTTSTIYIMYMYLPYNNNMNSDSIMMNFLMLKENSLELNKLYNFPTMNSTIMLINYLFLTLIIIVKITNINYGPLRKMN
uniref:NADH-ubiquinone oxidoreductase chain 6 n=1 Tax=Archichauliodes deceptor TaxID=1909206 RepID=A0A343A2V2_9NEOP|nr:NADH dehydrogenase subunit 6 [Archichauliodes deceptor]AOX48546.1 NADH dehydrogenase subunit 6 [Archichauliodes deceptor]